MNIESIEQRVREAIRSLSSPHAERDWSLVLVIAIVAFVATALWNGRAYLRVSGGEALSAPAADLATTTPPTVVESLQALFDERAREERKYVGGEYSFTDPSQ